MSEVPLYSEYIVLMQAQTGRSLHRGIPPAPSLPSEEGRAEYAARVQYASAAVEEGARSSVHQHAARVHHKRPFEGHPSLVLGASASFLELFYGHLSPKANKIITNLLLIEVRRALGGQASCAAYTETSAPPLVRGCGYLDSRL